MWKYGCGGGMWGDNGVIKRIILLSSISFNRHIQACEPGTPQIEQKIELKTEQKIEQKQSKTV